MVETGRIKKKNIIRLYPAGYRSIELCIQLYFNADA